MVKPTGYSLPQAGGHPPSDTSGRPQVFEQTLHLLRPLDVREVAATRDRHRLDVRDDAGQPDQVGLRREYIAVPADRQGGGADAAPLAKIIVRRGPGCCGEACRPGVVAEPAEHPGGNGCGFCEEWRHQGSHHRGGPDCTDQGRPCRTQDCHGAHGQQHANKRRERRQG